MTHKPFLPPQARSAAAWELIVPAGQGRFVLPHCRDCGTFAWPVRDACPACLSSQVALDDAPRGAVLIAGTTAEVPSDPYFQARKPWRTGLVQMDCGPQALVHLHPACMRGDRLRLSLLLDRGGHAVLHAGPETEVDMSTDPQWLEMTCNSHGRHILITDARHAAAVPLAHALMQAGAARVWLGLDEGVDALTPCPTLDALPEVRTIALDLRSDASVAALAAQIGDEIEVVINTADLVRPGGIEALADPGDTQAMMEIAVFGLARLIRHFAPILARRASSGKGAGAAWVNLVPVMANVPHPGFIGYSLAHAAASALVPSLRATLAEGGARLMTVYAGPTDSPDFGGFSGAKTSGQVIAAGIVEALKGSLDEVVLGDLARDWLDRHARAPRALEWNLNGAATS